VSAVIAGLRRMQPSTMNAARAIDDLITQLENRQDGSGYDARKDEGIPVGGSWYRIRKQATSILPSA